MDEPARRSVRVEADGGSRGNPGPAAYGALLTDADTGETIAQAAERIGVTTNNVAEYHGLLAGLELYAEHAAGADLEVRMDSQLVIEQMAGRWRVKHPDLQPLAARAAGLAPAGTTWTWVPRAENTRADRILNEVLDGRRPASPPTPATVAATGGTPLPSPGPTGRSVSPGMGAATTLVLVRHGATDHTLGRRFSGGLGGSDPGLGDEGRAQVRATADWLAPLAERVDVVVTSPVRRTRETADIIGARLEREVRTEDGLAEMEFGAWDGLTFAEVSSTYPDDLAGWLGSLDHAPSGGESLRQVQERVLASRDRLVAEHAGRTVLVVSHVTPISVLVADALGAPLEAVHRVELAPASVTVVSWFDDGRSLVRTLNARPTDAAFIGG